MKYYSNRIRQRVRAGPDTLGVKLAKLALRKEFSVIDVARCTGATRTTVYNWYSGKGVTQAYQQRVTELSDILTAAPDYDTAWRTACKKFRLRR